MNNLYAHLPPHAYDNQVEVWLVQEAGGNLTLLSHADGSPCSLSQPYSLIGTLCSTRALDVDDASLQVDGKCLKAEHYLALWREASTVSAAEMSAKGYRLLWTHCRPSAAMCAELQRETTSQDTNERRRMLLQHPDRTDDGQVMCWALDLFTPSGVQAFEALRWVYLRSEDEVDLGVPKVSLELIHPQATAPAAHTLPLDSTATELHADTPDTQLSFSL